MIKYLFAKTKRLINFQICKRFLYEKSLKKHKIHLTKSFLQEFSGKKILMMDASPLVNNMFQQRPHHFVNFWHKKARLQANGTIPPSEVQKI